MTSWSEDQEKKDIKTYMEQGKHAYCFYIGFLVGPAANIGKTCCVCVCEIYLFSDGLAVTHGAATPQDLEECLVLKASRIPVEENSLVIINLLFCGFHNLF